MSETNHERSPQSVWADVERIYVGRVIPDSKEHLMEYIEAPLQAAVGTLYDKNVVTLGSSCNYADFARGFAWISLDWTTLSEENKQVVMEYPHHEISEIEYTDIQIAGLFFPIEFDDLPDTVSAQALAVSEGFNQQPPTNPPEYQPLPPGVGHGHHHGHPY